MTRDYILLIPSNKPEFCVARLIRIPNFSRASLAQQILAQIAQPVRITDRQSLADLYIVMAPQPFPRRFQGDNQVDDPGYPQTWEDKIETSDPPSRKSSQTRVLCREEQLLFTFLEW